MKKTATIILSAIFGMGVALAVPAFGSDAVPGMKDMAKGVAKQVAQQKVDEAHDVASKKLDALVGDKAEKATDEANSTAKDAEKSMHEMKEKAEHGMDHMGK